MAAQLTRHQRLARQSPPVDLSKPCDDSWVKGRHILITGGVGGFGAGFARRWAAAGASVVVGDINSQKGEEMVGILREELGNPNVHFVHCNVADWDSQVRFFKESLKLSPHGGIDAVVANAGIAKPDPLATPGDLGIDEPPRPDFSTTDVNLYGVLYTVHLAMYYLPRNPGSTPSSPDRDPRTTRDRHILLVGSMASLAPICIQPQYGAAKHAVLGLFRSLRTSTFVEGVRINMICPYFVETPILTRSARLLLAGTGLGKVEDVVEAATRLTADSSICGRALCIGPPAKALRAEDGQLIPVAGDGADGVSGPEIGIWECYADDFEAADAWTKRFVVMLSYIGSAKGWVNWAVDVAKALFGGWGR
ncbi:Short-chain dehydrogenase/reductase SDR [Macrophomina phaseolina MS6]|uniref:Short-chain dehydrogenase/reductase SDR n=1 Tax=Macrophomina phaseolina (strain MS6) TaxID=1126212 RepID=K2QJV9_MACPH|nr:Short-chain dehydrogenase/reductase SDR [Macrophomina phaseolina MS6]